MADINKLTRILNGVARQVDISTNTLVVDNLKVKLGSAFQFTFTGSLTAGRSITMPDADVNLGNIAALVSLSGVAGGSTDLGSFTGSNITSGSTIKSALQQLSNAIDSVGGNNEFFDTLFRVKNFSDPTKKISLSAAGIASGNTRSLIMPDFNVDLGNLTDQNISASAAIAYSKLNLAGSIVNADIATGAAIAYAKLALTASIVNADISATAAIAYSKLNLASSIVDADISATAAIAYSKLALTASIVNADIASGAAIAYSKLNLAASIVNADIASGAAIALNKLAALTASRALVSDGSGVISASSVTSTELGYVSGVTSAIQTQLNSKLALAGGTMSGAINMGGNAITSLADPTNAQDAATKNYVDAVANGVSWKNPVKAASTGNLTLSGAQTVDGVSLVAGDRILVKDQSTQSQNGIYVVASGSWTRAVDMDSLTPLDEFNGAAVFVLQGTVNGNKGFVENANVTVVGTSPVTFAQFSAAGAYTAGNGISISGQSIAVLLASSSGLQFTTGALDHLLDGTTLSKSASGLKVAAGGITNTEVSASAGIVYSKLSLSNSIVNADIATGAAIVYSKLALTGSIVNADIATGAAIAYAKLSLSNSIVNADIATSAAIAYSKLALSNSIVNADIAAGAAIAYSKLNLALSITNADIATSAAIAYSKLALTGSIVNADISASAAIAYTKLNLSASIVDADISATAAIAYSKLSLSNSILQSDLTALSVGTAQLQANSVTPAKVATSVFDGTTISGGNGSAASVLSAPLAQKSMVAGEAFAANTSFLVRWAISGETAGRVYKADQDASSLDKFYVQGIALSTSAVAAGQSINVILLGTSLLGSSDTAFSASDIGKPVYLTASGAFSVTCPTTINYAVVRVGMVENTDRIFVNPQVMYVN